MTAPADFAGRLVAWHARAGRHDLPWQHPATAYRVWVSEVMLQQTQVNTVIPYFGRFMARFADLPALAAAPVGDVLALWSGLGYYARARNLHAAARAAVDRHGGDLPADLAALTALPGIGRSTAGAILALAHGIRAPILDGNVRRVLARHRAVPGWPGTPAVARTLWALADTLTPTQAVGTYTQAVMDLGATVCTARAPRCGVCPVAADCRARMTETIGAFPAPRPRRSNPRRAITVLVLRDERGAVLLEQRPPAGIWGGLWSLPEYTAGDADPHALETHCQQAYGVRALARAALPVHRHALTHVTLDLHPLLIETAPSSTVLEGAGRVWYNPGTDSPPGLPAPVRRLLDELPRVHGAVLSNPAPR